MEADIEELYNSVAGELIARFETKLSARLRVDSSKVTISTEMDQATLQHVRTVLCSSSEICYPTG